MPVGVQREQDAVVSAARQAAFTQRRAATSGCASKLHAAFSMAWLNNCGGEALLMDVAFTGSHTLASASRNWSRSRGDGVLASAKTKLAALWTDHAKDHGSRAPPWHCIGVTQAPPAESGPELLATCIARARYHRGSIAFCQLMDSMLKKTATSYEQLYVRPRVTQAQMSARVTQVVQDAPNMDVFEEGVTTKPVHEVGESMMRSAVSDGESHSKLAHLAPTRFTYNHQHLDILVRALKCPICLNLHFAWVPNPPL